MKLAILSDVTFEPVLKQMGNRPDFSVQKYVYSDQIVSELINSDSHLQGVDACIIHFDSFFYRYTDAYIAETDHRRSYAK